MARAFKSTPKGFVAGLERAERRLLRALFNDVIQLLDDGRPGTPVVPTPANPAPAVPGTPAAESDTPQDAAGDRPGPAADPFWGIVEGLGRLEATPASGDRAADGTDAGTGTDAGPGTGPTSDPHRPAPADPALARLLPAGVAGDDEAAEHAAGEFRALTEDAVRRSKTEDLQRAVAALQSSPVVLSEPEAVSFSRALNDVRLVLSTRLGIESEEDAERVHAVDDWSAATDVESYMALLYNFTTWLLETLMVALSTRLPD